MNDEMMESIRKLPDNEKSEKQDKNENSNEQFEIEGTTAKFLFKYKILLDHPHLF